MRYRVDDVHRIYPKFYPLTYFKSITRFKKVFVLNVGNRFKRIKLNIKRKT